MVVLIFLFFIVGLLSIILETVTPHGISGIIGFALVIFSCYLAIQLYGMQLGLIYCAMALTIAVIVARFALVQGVQWMDLKPPARKGAQAAKAESPTEPRAGETARVIQPLRPTGTIEWQGRRFPARTLYPEREVPIGAEVVVRSKDSVFLLCEESAPPAGESPA